MENSWSKECVYLKFWCEDFPDGPVVKNPPSNAGDTGLVPGWGMKIPQATWYSHNNNIKRNEKKMNIFVNPKC